MVNIDNVYQKVLAIANKEQRGYITPQEFNLFADQVQLDIFEQYFYDINQWTRQHGNDHIYADMLNNLNEKLSEFQRYDRTVNVTSATSNPNFDSWGDVSIGDQLSDIYKIGMVRIKYQTEPHSNLAEELSLNELNTYNVSPLTKSSKKRPFYINYPLVSSGTRRIKIYPYPSSDDTIDRVKISYVRKPTTPNWGYVVVNNHAQYDGSNSTDFELHSSEEGNLILKILQLAGLAMKDVGLYQMASQEEIKDIQQEKQ